MIKTPILIAGAGPTGLMLSAQLHRYGAQHVIVDRKPGITPLSKALAVQARTLEQYRQLGFVKDALSKGFAGKSVRFVVNGNLKAEVPLGDIGAGLSAYPYLFILEQSQNEALLLQHIEAAGGTVRWSSEIAGLRRSSNGYAGKLLHSSGGEEDFECDYLIGCDGGSSTVRQFSGMPFQGSTNEQLFFVADINIEMEFEKHGLLLIINGKEFLAFFPMNGPDQYRAIGVLPAGVADPDDFSFDVLRKHIEANIGIPAKITGHNWHSGYRVHHRIVDAFRSENIFLAGDAAHVHSPAGGQGMNTGLGDAVNLGWKLAAVINRWADEKLLDSYNEERRPFGVQLVHTTDRAFTVIVSKSWFPRFMRTCVLPLVLKSVLRFQILRRLMFKTISQTRISYAGSSLSDGSRSRKLRSGDRFPWFTWDGGNSFEWLEKPGYAVLRLADGKVSGVAGWQGPVQIYEVTGPALTAAAAAGLPESGCVIVRPDMHIASISRA